MGLIKKSVTIAAGVTVANLLDGEIERTLKRPSAVKLFMTQEGTGAAEVDFNIGTVIAGQDLVPNPAVTSGVIDRSVDGLPPAAGQVNDEIQLRARETGGANPVTLNYQVEITALA